MTLGAFVPALAVWLVSAFATAWIASLAWGVLRRRMHGWHPIDRGRIALAVATSPVIVPTLLVVLVIAPGLLGLAVPAIDHCTLHPDHPHLCLVHPTAALPSTAAIALLAFSAVALFAVARVLRSAWQRARDLRFIAGVATRTLTGRVELVDSDRPFALAFGLVRPRALVSTGLVRALPPDAASAVVSHEAEHVRRRDPLRQLVARIASAPIWPSVRRDLLSVLALAAEQACDEHVSQVDGDRLRVARAILAAERVLAESASIRRADCTGIDSGSVALRVASLLDRPAPRWSRWWLLALAAPLIAFAAASPLHHGVEHLLARVSGTG